MSDSTLDIAKRLLAGELGEMKDLRVHMFEDDEEAHDDEAVTALHDDFIREFGLTQAQLNAEFGRPRRSGNDDDKEIPLAGLLRFSIWSIGERKLYLAVSHEDRETPILLMLGTVE